MVASTTEPRTARTIAPARTANIKDWSIHVKGIVEYGYIFTQKGIVRNPDAEKLNLHDNRVIK